MPDNKKKEPIIIKKYPNRRLYDTSTSTYVTMEYLADMVRSGLDFVVLDAKTNEDITHSVLTQIIVDEEAKGQNLLPLNFLRQLISMYGGGTQWVFQKYLEQAIETFNNNRDKFNEMMSGAMGGVFPMSFMQEMGKQNMEAMEKTIRMFTQMASPTKGSDTPQPDVRLYEAVANMQKQLLDLAKQVNIMAEKKK